MKDSIKTKHAAPLAGRMVIQHISSTRDEIPVPGARLPPTPARDIGKPVPGYWSTSYIDRYRVTRITRLIRPLNEVQVMTPVTRPPFTRLQLERRMS